MRGTSRIVLFACVALLVGVAVYVRKKARPQPQAAEPIAIHQPINSAEPARTPDASPPRQLPPDSSVPPQAAALPPVLKKSKPRLLTEPELMEKLRKAQDTDDYVLSYDLAREGLRRWPESSDAPEMAAMVVKSLARQGKVSEARAEAEEMVNKYAGTHWAREVERHTGAHPHVNQVPPQ
jgi:hypothetical protein